MSLFKPTPDQTSTLQKAVTKFAHEPFKSQLLARLQTADAEYQLGSEEWGHLKFCLEKHYVHMQAEARRDPNKKSVKADLAKAAELAKRFQPNFS
jgi:hypothetical protein